MTTGARSGGNVDVERLRVQHRLMHRIRAFEEVAVESAREGLVKGAIHPSIGQEGVAVGVCGPLERSDLLLSNHRGHGHTLAKGADPLAMMLELFGRVGGVCGGKGGSMHIADFRVGMLGANGVVGANILIAAGAAHGLKLRQQAGDREAAGRIVVCIFGDGAVNRGPFLEGLNWAGIYALPVLFVCEDNAFASTTRTRTLTSGPGPAARAQALGIPATEVDGNDVLAVDATTRALVEAVRAGAPRFLLARTYRLTGHTAADPATYRSDEEVARHREDDPIGRAAELLAGAGVPAHALEADRRAARAEMERVRDEARAAPWPPVEEAFRDVQDVGAPEPPPWLGREGAGVRQGPGGAP